MMHCLRQVKGPAWFTALQHFRWPTLQFKIIQRTIATSNQPFAASKHRTRHKNQPGASRNLESSKKRFSSYQELITLRRLQARRSVLVHVNNGKSSCDFVYDFCRRYGRVLNLYYDDFCREQVLVEFENEQVAVEMNSSADHVESSFLPIKSRILNFIGNSLSTTNLVNKAPVLMNGSRGANLSDLYNAENMCEQMAMYYHAERLTELETRLRYFVCSTLEDYLTPLFPTVEILPYGSSSNRLGRHGSDLDMAINVNTHQPRIVRNSPFRYVTKAFDDDRLYIQKALRMTADVLLMFAPQVSRVQKIVHARVPILNFHHETTNTCCDLSMYNVDVLTMSEMLYLIGEKEPSFRPMIFALRKWASLNDLTLDRPGPRFSNFMLTLMVIAFLQLRNRPSLPPLRQFLNGTGTSVLDKNQIPFPSRDESKDSDLLVDFFKFYSDFDFSNNGLSLYDGRIVLDKPASCPLYIQNPLEESHNCAMNVHTKELNYLQACIRTTAERLSSHGSKSEQSWGLLNLVEGKSFGTDVNVGINVRKLFAT